MAIFMLCFGIALLTAPNPVAFEQLAEGGIVVSPATMGNLFLLSALGFSLSVFSLPDLERYKYRLPFLPRIFEYARSRDGRRTIFLILSLPVAIYMMTLGFLGFTTTGATLVGAIYFGIFTIIFLMALSVYGAPHPLLERLTLLALTALFALGAYSANNRPAAFVLLFQIKPVVVTALFSFGAIGYSLLLHPRVRKALTDYQRRVWMLFSQIGVPIYAALNMIYMANERLSVIGSITLMGLFGIISMTAHALFRGSYRSEETLKAGALVGEHLERGTPQN